MQVPRVMRRVNRAITNPFISLFAGFLPPHAIVYHVGRRSRRKYQTPVVAFSTRRGLVTPLPYGTDTDWCLNVLKAGHCTLQRAGQRIQVSNPRIVKTAAVLPLFPAVLRPALQLANLPGYLLLDSKEQKGSARKP